MKTRQSAIQSTTIFVALSAMLCGTPAALSQDAGQSEAVSEPAATSEEAVVAPKKGDNAEARLKQRMLDKEWAEGWDPVKKRLFVVQTAEFTTKDPATDKSLYLVREAAMKRAVLQAKAAIIETINQQMSAEERLDVPGTDVSKALGAERDAIQAKIIVQRDRLARLLEQVDAAEAKTLREATFGERLKDLIAAATKKLDAAYDSSARQEAAAKEYEEAKLAYAEAETQYGNLLEKANALQPSSTQSSAIETLAKMPIYGATVVLQTESWTSKNGIYQIAVLATWSKALEQAARSIATSKPIPAEPGAKSVQRWLADQDLALMVGARQYVDNKGDRWFLGISAREYSEDMNTATRSQNRQLSEMFAKQMTLFSVYADVESWKQAQQMVEEYNVNGQIEPISMESMASKISQVVQKRQVRGMMKLGGGEFSHPVTGGGLYVSVFGINASMAKDCIDIEAANIAAKIEDNIHQSEEKGRSQANEAAVIASENRPADIARGAATQKQIIDNKVKENARDATRQIEEPAAVAPATQKKSTGGVFGGDVDVSDDF